MIRKLLLGAALLGIGSANGNAGIPLGTEPAVLSDDGGWCWFESPRIVLQGQRLIVGSVAGGAGDTERRGDIEAVVYDLQTRTATVVQLHDKLGFDDHASPAILARPDGRLLAVYAAHDTENHFYYRLTDSTDPTAWRAEHTFVPTASSRITYANLYTLSAEHNRIYNFYRGLDASFKPSYAYSDDLGASWKSGNVVIDFHSQQRHRPYVVYASNGTDTIHLLYTDAHPRDFDNSLYHIMYRDGTLLHTDGTPIAPLTKGLANPSDGTRIFAGTPDRVAWCIDLVLDAAGHPVAVYSVQMDSAGLPVGQGGDDIRYRYARWDGKAWQDYPLAFAGTRLYPGEDDYSGLVAIDPFDPDTVYLSTNADPETGEPLVSAADGLRHWEIFRGVTSDSGASWMFTPVTQNSTADNLRPIMPSTGDGGRRALVWLRGKYKAYTDFRQQVVALVWRN
jgi:hypothetical protein